MSNSNTTAEQLGEAYKNCAATSTQLGYSLDDTTAALMVMADGGINGGEAGGNPGDIVTTEMYISDYSVTLVKDTSYKGLWEVPFTLKEF